MALNRKPKTENRKPKTENRKPKTENRKPMNTQKEIKLKTGETLPKGLPVSFVDGRPSRCLVYSPRHSEPLKVRVTSAFKAPSQASLERWNDEGYCKAINGSKTEPDGYGSDGSPSWLLALQMI